MRRAIITGIRRIGKEIALKLLQEGWSIGLVYHTSEEVYRELKALDSDRVFGCKSSLDSEQEVKRVVSELSQALGGVDALVHLASPYFPTPLEELTEEALYAHFKPTALSFLFMAKELKPLMQRNKGLIKGRLIAFGDWATNTTPYRNYSAYFVSKGALHTAVKVLAKELAPHILVNGIALGPTIKPPDFSDSKWEEYINKTPLKKAVSLNDVVRLTMFLLEVESMTGELINLDSGRHVSGECT